MFAFTLIILLLLQLCNPGPPFSSTPSGSECTGTQASRLGLSDMYSIISNLLEHGLFASTRSAYQSGVRCYLQFCMLYRLQPWPLAETTLYCFVAYHSQYRLAPSSIHLYLSGLYFCQISFGEADLQMSSLPRLHYTLWGLSRQQASYRWPKRLPITLSILRCLHRVWSAQPLTYDRVMLWAAACLDFFGFLRCGEFTHTSQRPCPLSPSHIRVDSHVQPTYITVFLTHSKIDVFGTGVTLAIGRTGGPICPVAALLAYLAVCSRTPGTTVHQGEWHPTDPCIPGCSSALGPQSSWNQCSRVLQS